MIGSRTPRIIGYHLLPNALGPIIVSVTLGISGLGNEILSAYDLNLLFDDALLNPASVVTGLAQFGGIADSSNSVSFAPGDIDTNLFSLLLDDDLAAAQADNFTWLTYNFLATADGATTLQFGADPDFERNFVGRDALSLDVALNSLCISVGTGTCAQSVPEPASIALVGVALTGLVVPGAVRRRRAAAAAKA